MRRIVPTDRRARDAALALVSTLALLGVASVLDVDRDRLLDPRSLTVGVVGALLVEAAFVRYPEWSQERWYRRSTQVTATLLVVVGGGVLTLAAGVWVLSALLAGLATYFVLLALSLAGLFPPVDDRDCEADADDVT